jgi:hypothetical protein
VTKEELQEIADSVIANWNMNLTPEGRKNFYRTWWRYVGDLNCEESRAAVDAFILSDRPFPPRAGTVRRTVLAEALSDVLTLELAWAQASERIRAVQQGTWSPVAPLVGKAMAEAAIHGTSKDDHEAFTRAWRRVVEEFELEVLGLPDEES